MSDVFPVVLSFITAVITAIITSYIVNNKGYRFFHKGNLAENIRISRPPQIFQYEINNSSDSFLHIQDCDNYYIDTKGGLPERLEHSILTDFDNRWIYLYAENNSDITVAFARVHLASGRKINLYDWPQHFLKSEEKKGIFISREDAPQKIVIDYNGSDLVYDITNKAGFLTFEMKQPYRKEQ